MTDTPPPPLESRPESDGVSYKRHKGLISYTYKDVGSYGSFINSARLDAWTYAIKSHGLPTDRIIDLGCSYGSWAENWKELGFQERIGVDFNDEAIAKAKMVFEQAHIGDSSNMKQLFPQARLIGSNGMIIHVLEKETVAGIYQDAFDALASQGVFVLAAVNSDYYMTPSMFKPHTGPNSCTRTLEYHRELLEAAGFQIEEIVGTFINPWFCETTKFLASSESLKRSEKVFASLLTLGQALREAGEHKLFSENLFVCRKP